MLLLGVIAVFASLLICIHGYDVNQYTDDKWTEIAERMSRLEVELKSQKVLTEGLKEEVRVQTELTHKQDEINKKQSIKIEELKKQIKGQGHRSHVGNSSRKRIGKFSAGIQPVGTAGSNYDKILKSRRYLLGDKIETFVGFTAYLDHGVDHLGIDQNIVFNTVLFNDGGWYNNGSGIFTCPADGVYMFFFEISNHAGHQTVAKLVVNGANKVDAIADSEGGNANTEVQGSNMAILRLTAGTHVSVENYRWANVDVASDSNNRFSTFSGVLLYE